MTRHRRWRSILRRDYGRAVDLLREGVPVLHACWDGQGWVLAFSPAKGLTPRGHWRGR